MGCVGDGVWQSPASASPLTNTDPVMLQSISSLPHIPLLLFLLSRCARAAGSMQPLRQFPLTPASKRSKKNDPKTLKSTSFAQPTAPSAA